MELILNDHDLRMLRLRGGLTLDGVQRMLETSEKNEDIDGIEREKVGIANEERRSWMCREKLGVLE